MKKHITKENKVSKRSYKKRKKVVSYIPQRHFSEEHEIDLQMCAVTQRV